MLWPLGLTQVQFALDKRLCFYTALCAGTVTLSGSTLVVKFPNRQRHDPCHTSLTPVLLFQRIRIYLCSFLPPIYGWYLYYLYSVMMSIGLANQIGGLELAVV